MYLRPDSREFYTLTIATDPPAAGTWEASFDGGATWHLGESVDGKHRWLVAGGNVDQGNAAAVITAATVPLIRLTDNPEVIVRSAPRIALG